MRISTLQMYKQSVQSMQAQQSELHRTEAQLASGKRISKPSDDPTGAAKVLDLNSTIGVIDQFSRNVAGAESALAFEENVIAGVNNSLQRVRELAIQGNNASNSDVDRQAIAQEIYQKLDELTSLQHSRCERRVYIRRIQCRHAAVCGNFREHRLSGRSGAAIHSNRRGHADCGWRFRGECLRQNPERRRNYRSGSLFQ